MFVTFMLGMAGMTLLGISMLAIRFREEYAKEELEHLKNLLGS